MTKILEALKPGVVWSLSSTARKILQFRIKEVYKMSLKQLDKEMNAVGLVPVRTVVTLSLQHIAIFEKHN
jgi:hypothetical protein